MTIAEDEAPHKAEAMLENAIAGAESARADRQKQADEEAKDDTERNAKQAQADHYAANSTLWTAELNSRRG